MKTLEERRKITFGVGLPTSQSSTETIKLAVTAESLGFDQIWIGDHYHSRNPFLLLTAIACQTQKIKLCTGVTNPFHVSPAVLAATALTLEELAIGRTILGLGIGDEITLNQIGVYPDSPIEALRQRTVAIRDLCLGKTISETFGQTVWKNVRLRMKHQPIPIYLGVQGTRMINLALEVADGIIVNSSSPSDYQRIVQLKEKNQEKPKKIIGYLIIELEQTASSLLRRLVSQIIAGASESTLNRHNINNQEVDRIKEFIQREQYQKAGNALTNQMLENFAIVGSKQNVEQRIEDIITQGTDGVILGGPLAKSRSEGLQKLAQLLDKF